MKKLLLVSLFLLSSNHSLFPSELAIEKLDLVPPAPMTDGGSTRYFQVLRTGTDQGVYLLGETHDFDVPGQDINRRHLEVFFTMLLNAELDRAENKYHVLVEHSIDIHHVRPGYKAKPVSVMNGILPAFKKQPFRYSVVEDCEVRRATRSSTDLFNIWPQQYMIDNPSNYSTKIFALFKQETGYDITLFAFKDIVIEFDKLHQQMSDYMNQWDDPLIKQEFRKSLDEATREFDAVRVFIAEGGRDFTQLLGTNAEQLFSPDDTLFSFCQNKIKYDCLPLLRWLALQIRDSASNFLDLKLFHRVLQLRKADTPVKKIVIMAGARHCRNLYFHLLRSQSGTIAYGIMGDKFNVTEYAKIAMPLTEAEELERKKSTCYWFLSFFRDILKNY